MTWKPTRWWQVLAPDGSLWCETSDEDEARERMRPGDTLYRCFEHTEHEWRIQETRDTTPGGSDE